MPDAGMWEGLLGEEGVDQVLGYQSELWYHSTKPGRGTTGTVQDQEWGCPTKLTSIGSHGSSQISDVHLKSIWP